MWNTQTPKLPLFLQPYHKRSEQKNGSITIGDYGVPRGSKPARRGPFSLCALTVGANPQSISEGGYTTSKTLMLGAHLGRTGSRRLR